MAVRGGVNQRTWAALAAALALTVFTSLPACAASSSYVGISLSPGAAEPELQQLARRARAGDKQAQFDLARRFEEGRGLPIDLARAERLYLMASMDRGGSRYVYSPPQAGDPEGGTAAVNQGPRIEGLPEARAAWVRARSERLAREAAEQATGGLRNEAYLGRKLSVDRQLGAAAALDLPVVAIRGPRSLSGSFEQADSGRRDSPLCTAVEALVRHYRSYGFSNCLAIRYKSSKPTAHESQRDVYLLSYADDYPNSEDYQSISGHGTYDYRPPFTSLPRMEAQDSLCGSFLSYELVINDGTTYSILISENLSTKSRSDTAAHCRGSEGQTDG